MKALLFLFAILPAHASLVTQVGGGSSFGGTPCGSGSQSGTDHAEASWNNCFGGLALVSATASYGALATVHDDVAGDTAGGFADASFSDMVTIDGASGLWRAAYLASIQVTEHRRFITSYTANIGELVVQDKFPPCCFLNPPYEESLFYYTPFQPFTDGVPFLLSAAISARSVTNQGGASFSTHLQLLHLAVLDSEGNPIFPAAIGESGTVYPTPEPGTWVLVGVGLVAVGAWRRGRGSKA